MLLYSLFLANNLIDTHSRKTVSAIVSQWVQASHTCIERVPLSRIR